MSTHLIPAIGSQRQKVSEFEASRIYKTARSQSRIHFIKKKKERRKKKKDKTEQGLIGFRRWKHQEFKVFLCYTDKANLGNHEPLS